MNTEPQNNASAPGLRSDRQGNLTATCDCGATYYVERMCEPLSSTYSDPPPECFDSPDECPTCGADVPDAVDPLSFENIAGLARALSGLGR